MDSRNIPSPISSTVRCAYCSFVLVVPNRDAEMTKEIHEKITGHVAIICPTDATYA